MRDDRRRLLDLPKPVAILPARFRRQPTRRARLDRKAPPPDTKASRAGYSIGRWEGDTLVVETTHFLPGVLNADARVLHGSQLRITERYQLDASGTKLTRRYEASDPEYFEDVWSQTK